MEFQILLAFQQNYSRYDGPSESGLFFTLSKPGLTSFLQVFSSDPQVKALADDDFQVVGLL